MSRLFVLCAAVCLFFISCNRQKTIALDERNALSLAPDIKWAVVKEPYVTYHVDKSWDSPTGDYERKGAILQVVGTSEGEDGAVWFRFKDGYLPSSAVTIESNRYRAERTAQSITQ